MTKRVAVVVALVCAATGCKQDNPPKPAASQPADPIKPPEQAPAVKPLASADAKVSFYKDCLATIARKDWTAFGACYSKDAVSTFVDFGMPPLNGRDEIVAKGLQVTAKAIPDMALHPQLILQNGDRLAAVLIETGTQSGPLVTSLGETPASNKQVGLYVIDVARLSADEPAIAKDWHFEDVNTLLGQIGANHEAHRAALPSPATPPTIVIAKNDATEKANLAVYQQITDAFNKHDLKGLDEPIADDYENIYATEAASLTRKQESAQDAEAFKHFSNLAWTPSDMWAAGDYVVAVASITGTNDGDFSKTEKKTGKQIDLTGVEIMKIVNGKVKQHWEFYNGAALAIQLGLAKPAVASDVKR